MTIGLDQYADDSQQDYEVETNTIECVSNKLTRAAKKSYRSKNSQYIIHKWQSNGKIVTINIVLLVLLTICVW